MASAREAEARVHRAMAVRDWYVVALSAEQDGTDELIGNDTP